MASTNSSSSNTSSNSSTIEDFLNPYFLHHGDSPGVALVTTPFTKTNHHTWSRSMITSLHAKNKLSFIDGSLPQPAMNYPLHFAWGRCNSMVVAWITNSLSKDIASSVLFSDNARNIWLDLQQRFSRSSAPRVFQLKKSISDLSQGQLSITQYYTQLKTLWDELQTYHPAPCCSCSPSCSCGALQKVFEREQFDYTIQFLVGLNDSFSAIRGHLLMMDPLPTINKAFSLLLQDEGQRQLTSISAPIFDSAAMATIKPSFNAVKSFKKDKIICSHCGISGHTIAKCYRLHGFPPGFKFTKSKKENISGNQVISDNPSLPFTQEQCTQLLALLQPSPPSSSALGASTIPNGSSSLTSMHMTGMSLSASSSIFASNCFSSLSSSTPWIIDTGATDHMVSSVNFLTSITSSVKASVNLPNGNSVSVTHIGTDMRLWKMIGLGRLSNGLYHLLSFSNNNCSSANTVNNSFSSNNTHKSFDIWHQRLGHLSSERLYLLRDHISFSTSNKHTYFLMSPSISDVVLPTPQTDCSPDISHFSPNTPSASNSMSSSSSQSSDSNSLTLQRTTRPSHPPSYLHDYHCSLANNFTSVPSSLHSSDLPSSGNQYPLSSILSYCNLSSAYHSFILNVSVHTEPQYCHQAVKIAKWRNATDKEIRALEENQTWSLAKLPHGYKTIGCKWVYRIKYNSNGSIE
ncbi:uncharacterized protein LOC131148773 [Malania oleifera]|uniref:uncharacterized protein LOC131148773 n=1 Tax=Malania oleifera TaxID=397392 RepID=UPI0025AE6D35|nr:uncharacterized protein LOC131148773 [Malania oleifera]